MASSEIGKLMTGLAKARAADVGADEKRAAAALAPLLAEIKAEMRSAVHARVDHAKKTSGNDNAR